ncbi:ribonuclease PH [Mesoterricola silvestris]|uniref:Ribonuclease PH n=1 Tax=Mesoterricola silvestris TaxID=2927979 RepID=A0AA48GSN6_9BACT|nr:ribonuclease PH [Mesoterricola silvestris]BDU74950.1 ribonuclease PH [Mesoterricola silvestris]
MRLSEESRSLALETGVQLHAEGSCLVRLGNTHVLCSASLEDRVPEWMRGRGKGWITSEYGMLPRATHTRSAREAAKGRQQGRTVEIQRLIGRSLRQAVDLAALGEVQLTLDCDVVNADGGTRCASITGAWVALALALKARGLERALINQVAAVSVGILEGCPGLRQGLILDLEYEEDHRAAVDCNLVASLPTGGASELSVVEFQSTGEGRSFSRTEATALLDLGLKGCAALMEAQRKAVALG